MTNYIYNIHDEIAVYKLFRLTKDEKIHPLFINRNEEIILGEWLKAECYPTKGFAVRKGWHCCFKPYAPHWNLLMAKNVSG